jgi:hypothetical protein
VLGFEPATKTHELLQREMLGRLADMTVARELRLLGVAESIPGVLWLTVLLGALLTIAFVWMLHMSAVAQLVLGGAAAFFLGMPIFPIYAMDHPLKGAVGIAPRAYESLYDLVTKWAERE